MRGLPSAALAILVAFGTVRADEAPVLVSSGGIGRPTLVATSAGYAAVWWDASDAGAPGRPEGGLRFVTLDAALRATTESIPLTIDDRYGLANLYSVFGYAHLEPVREGFLLFAQVDAYEVDTLRIGSDGTPGKSHELLFADEIYPISVAPGWPDLIVTYPEWYGTFQNWSQTVGGDGAASGDRLPLAISRQGSGELYTLDSQVTPHRGRYVAVWSQYPIGIRLRELSPSGVPEGDPILARAGRCIGNVAVASDGRVQAIVYADGCAQKDVYLILRDKDRVGPPIPLAKETYDEGIDPFGEARHPLRVVRAGNRFAALYRTAGLEPSLRPGVFLVEFDASGRRIASRRLDDRFQIDANDEIDLLFDSRRGRYVIAWGGSGPEGWGFYALALNPAF